MSIKSIQPVRNTRKDLQKEMLTVRLTKWMDSDMNNKEAIDVFDLKQSTPEVGFNIIDDNKKEEMIIEELTKWYQRPIIEDEPIDAFRISESAFRAGFDAGVKFQQYMRTK